MKTSSLPNHDGVRSYVRERYGAIAEQAGTGCGCSATGCCGGGETEVPPANYGEKLGYTAADLNAVPAGSDLGLGCGNPVAIASIRPGETVLDLGAGGGIDCFLAAKKVGASGRVIGVDMTPDMVTKARTNARKGGYQNVEFRLGEIEALPVADASVDLILSNCVVNLSPEKSRVLHEAYRVLKPGGRLMVLEFSQIPNDLMQKVYDLYSFNIIPVMGQIVAGDRDSYQYLVESIRKFPDQETFAGMIRQAGFGQVKYRNLTMGIAALHSGWKL